LNGLLISAEQLFEMTTFGCTRPPSRRRPPAAGRRPPPSPKKIPQPKIRRKIFLAAGQPPNLLKCSAAEINSAKIRLTFDILCMAYHSIVLLHYSTAML